MTDLRIEKGRTMPAVNEAALMIARADDPRAALESGQAAVDTLLDRLVGEPAA